jgi:GGDEF domain-containing protein
MRLWRLQFDDSYYWLTAHLAARRAQRWTCRLIAFVMIVFGAVPTMLVFSSLETQTLSHHGLAVGVTVCCVAMGSQWLRGGWPSRRVSQVCSVVGAVCIAAACLLATDPVLGLLGATSFAVLNGYVGLFHSVRLLTVTWLLAGAAMMVLVVRLVAVNGALAVGAVLVVVLLNVLVVFLCRFVVRLIRPDIVHDHLEPLTGLPTREGFYDQIGTLLGARSRGDDRYLVVVVVSIDSFSLLTSVRGRAGADQARVTVAQCVRETVRRGALVSHPGDAEFFIADLFTNADPAPLSGRLRHAIVNAAAGLTVSIGVVTTPLKPVTSHPPFDVVEELLTIATSAMFEARAAGGNQSRYAINPPLTVLNDANNPSPPESTPEHGNPGGAT